MEVDEMPEHIKDVLCDWVDLHRTMCSVESCREPHNVLAYLCHCAGLHSDDLDRFREELEDYEDRCKNCTHVQRWPDTSTL